MFYSPVKHLASLFVRKVDFLSNLEHAFQDPKATILSEEVLALVLVISWLVLGLVLDDVLHNLLSDVIEASEIISYHREECPCLCRGGPQLYPEKNRI